MGKRIPRGWVLNKAKNLFQFQVYNKSAQTLPVYDENGRLYNNGSPIQQAQAQTMFFQEAGAGTYTAEVDLPAGAVLIDIIVNATALWAAATSATLIVGDATDDDGYYTGVNLKATDLLAGESLSFAHQGGKKGADLDEPGADKHVRRRSLAAARKIIAKVTSIGAGTAGKTSVTVLYALPDNVINAVKA